MLHETELQQADERAAQRYVQQCEELRQQLEKEKEELRQREHELAKQRQAIKLTLYTTLFRLVCHCCSTLTGKDQKRKITPLNLMSELTFTTFCTKKGCVVRERPRRFNLFFLAVGPGPSRLVLVFIASMFTRYEKQLQEEEVSLQQQRSRLYKELAEEKENLAQLASR